MTDYFPKSNAAISLRLFIIWHTSGAALAPLRLHQLEEFYVFIGNSFSVSKNLLAASNPTRHFLPLENLAGAKRSLELADKLFEVMLNHPKEGDQITVDIVESLHRSRLSAQKNNVAPPAKAST